MEHEVFVPVAAEPLRRVLADPARVARAVPGLQQDAGEAPISGRLKVRVGGSSITYRGTLRITARDDGSYTLDGDATEARGSGTVKLTLTLRLTPADDGTTLAFDGGVTGDGRIADLDAGVAATAGHRLLNRFAEGLAEGAAGDADAAGGAGDTDTAGGAGETRDADAAEAPSGAAATPMVPEEPQVGPEESITGADADVTPVAPPERGPSGPPEPEASDSSEPGAAVEPEGEGVASAAEPAPEVPADHVDEDRGIEGDRGIDEDRGTEENQVVDENRGVDEDRDIDEDQVHGAVDGAVDGAVTADGLGAVPGEPLEPAADGRIHEVDNEPPAEAAHARRTMIGRSAEEVDHAPPRGRYAPVPAPASVRGSATLRWAAPAAALVVASVIVIGRALRRRR